jgi:hypothetical protein
MPGVDARGKVCTLWRNFNGLENVEFISWTVEDCGFLLLMRKCNSAVDLVAERVRAELLYALVRFVPPFELQK